MNRTAWTVAKLNLRNLRGAWWVTGIVVVLMLVNTIVSAVVSTRGIDMRGQDGVGFGNFVWLMPLLAAIAIPALNYRRIVNLGGRRVQYFWGAALAYVVLAAAAALANVVLYYAIDRPVTENGRIGGLWNLTQVFGWTAHGPVVAFVQAFAFLLLFTAFVHLLVSMQDRWYGWVLDVAVVAVIAVFTPIAPLRRALVDFFHLVIFGPAVPQILACLVLAAALYAATRPVLAAKPI